MATDLHPGDVMRDVARGARNDEIIEVAYFLLELLADRAESAVDLAIEVEDRDALNHAASVFVARAGDLMPPSWSTADRVKQLSYRFHDMEKTIAAAITYTRRDSAGPAAAPSRAARRKRDAEKYAARMREENEAFNAVDLSPERVLECLREVAAEGPVAVGDVAFRLIAGTPSEPLADASVWRRIVANVTAQLRKAAQAGEVVQHRPDSKQDRRCRWAPAEVDRG